MKSTIYIGLFLLLSTTVQAQIDNKLTGPEAKNHKYWLGGHDSNNTPIRKIVMGPEAKNANPWNEKDYLVSTNTIETKTLKTLMGPEAKNRKYWIN